MTSERFEKAFLCFVILMSGFFNAGLSYAAPLSEDDPSVPWHILADEISYDAETDVYIGQGNVAITKKDRQLMADYVEFNRMTMDASAHGNVVLIAGSDAMIGDRIHINLNSETGTLYNGGVFLHENHFYIRGNTIRKTGQRSFSSDHVSFTTCDGEAPAWSITGRNLNVTIEGYGTVRHAAFRIGQIPVLYVPYLIFPVKLNRQTGLLTPYFGYSKRKGIEYTQPFFWAISESSDATLHWQYLQKRGNKFGAEYRYILNPESKGTVMFDFLNDRQSDDGSAESSDLWGYPDDGTNRRNADRYWFRFKHDQDLPMGISAKTDADIVSDQDYLPEFKRGASGFDASESWFRQFFGRDLDDYNDPVRVNRLFLGRTWDAAHVSGELRWHQNSLERNQSDADDTLHKLPTIQFAASRTRLSDSVFYADMNSEYIYFYRDQGVKGHRMDVNPRLYAPVRFRNYFTFETSAGFRETAWMTETPEDSDKNDFQHRELFDFRAELFTDLYRWFGGTDKYRHSVKPLLSYDYTPRERQHNLPNFDAVDRIGPKNQFSLSVTQILSRRSYPAAEMSEASSETSEKKPSAVYSQLCRLKLEQHFYPKELEDAPSTKDSFSALYGEIDLTPAAFFSFHADGYWDHYAGRMLSRNMNVRLSDGRGDSLSAEHRYHPDLSESVIVNLSLTVTPALSAFAEYERNIHEKEDVRKEVRLMYARQCWSLAMSYLDEGNDRSVRFMVDLYGLGGVSGK